MLEMWKMKNVTLFSLDEQQSNGPFYLLLSDRFTTFAPGICAIAPNRQIYIQIVLMKSKHLKGRSGPRVSNVTFFNHGGQLGPRVGNVTFFNHGGQFGPRVGDVT